MSSAQSQTVNASGLAHAQFLEEVIFAALSPVFAGRVYPGIAPDNVTPPYAVQTTVSDVPNDTLAHGRNLTNTVQQIDVYASQFTQARTLGEQTKAAIDALVGPLMGVTYQLGQSLFDSDVKLHRLVHQYSFLLPRNGGTS